MTLSHRDKNADLYLEDEDEKLLCSNENTGKADETTDATVSSGTCYVGVKVKRRGNTIHYVRASTCLTVGCDLADAAFAAERSIRTPPEPRDRSTPGRGRSPTRPHTRRKDR